jgi:hypothetical protein
MKLKDLKPNPTNPRIVKDEKFNKLVQSILDFPQMLEKRPMVVDENNIVLGGNMRLRALQHIKKNNPEFTKEFMPEGVLPESWVSSAAGWTEEQKREFVIKDNVSIGEWDWDALSVDWELHDLENFGIDLPSFDNSENKTELVDYSNKNKEIDFNEETKSQIVLNYTSEDFIKVKTALSQIAQTPEQAVYILLFQNK